jgi:hypothetical protein
MIRKINPKTTAAIIKTALANPTTSLNLTTMLHIMALRPIRAKTAIQIRTALFKPITTARIIISIISSTIQPTHKASLCLDSSHNAFDDLA